MPTESAPGTFPGRVERYGLDVDRSVVRPVTIASDWNRYIRASLVSVDTMTDDERHGARIDDGTLYIERRTDPLEIGSMEAVIDLMGGETYTLEYTARQGAVSWLATDDQDTITLDVREELSGWGYTDEFVRAVEECSLEETGESGYPLRTEVFVDLVTEIWDSKGNLET